jgi:hypothetical protein
VKALKEVQDIKERRAEHIQLNRDLVDQAILLARYSFSPKASLFFATIAYILALVYNSRKNTGITFARFYRKLVDCCKKYGSLLVRL